MFRISFVIIITQDWAELDSPWSKLGYNVIGLHPCLLSAEMGQYLLARHGHLRGKVRHGG